MALAKLKAGMLIVGRRPKQLAWVIDMLTLEQVLELARGAWRMGMSAAATWDMVEGAARQAAARRAGSSVHGGLH
jgi:hypothetical protein